MLKDTTYKEKFSMLQSWMPLIIEEVKKDLRNDHLKKDGVFVRQYFLGKNPAKLSSEEMAAAYLHAIANRENSEELAEFIANRWLLKHSDLYHYFEQELVKLNPNFSELEAIEQEPARKIMEGAIAQFGAIQTYLFCIFNSVVFPSEVYQALESKAEHHASMEQVNEATAQEEATIEGLKRGYEQQIARLTDKYEKKLSGLQKKYVQDVDMLKKQVSSLQRKISAS